MDHFLPAETKAARAAEFESLKQDSMNVWEYHMEFASLSKYAIHMLPTMEARVRRFVQGLSLLVINEASTTALNSDMNYGKMVAFAQATETRKLKNRMECQSSSRARSAGNFSGSSGGGAGRSAFRGWSSGPSHSFAQPLMGAQSSRPSHRNTGTHQQGRPVRRFQQRSTSGGHDPYVSHSDLLAYSAPPALIDVLLIGVIKVVIQVDMASSRASGSSQQQGSHAMIPALAITPPTHPSRGSDQTCRGGGQAIRDGGQLVRGRPKDVVQSGGAQPLFYAFPARPEAESSDVVITDMVPVCHRDASVLFDPGST
ncbi:uncharacterized protein [Nicotiana tomentosiformis]|uniref:uncharacterized protein n=1 Tax=Nicotiana tomentosiformis TaxID=4098 RepID=UPI00388C87FF